MHSYKGIPANLAGQMPESIMEELRQMVLTRADGERITWRGFSYTPQYWCIYFELGDNHSTFSEIIRRKDQIGPLKPLRFLVEEMAKNFGQTKMSSEQFIGGVY